MLALVRIALSRPYTFVVMAMLIVIAGVLSWIRTPTDIFPAIRIPVVAVIWTYNGLPPDEMSGRVIYYYERQVSSYVNDIEHLESQSLPGYGVVKIFFQPTVDINAALAQIGSVSQTVLKQLPPGITPPFVVNFNAASVPVIQLALSSETLAESKIFDAGQNIIRPQLATVAGAAMPSPFGGRVRQIQIDVDQAKLRSYGLSAADVVAAVGNQDLIVPVGTQKIGGKEYEIRLNDSPREISELGDLPIRSADGATVRIADVAHVHDSSPPQTNIVHVDGVNAVLMTIIKAGAASTIDVINGVKDLVPRLNELVPEGVKLTVVGDQSGFVQSAVSSVLFEGALAAGLTGLMILVFLGSWRSTAIIVISIPLAILFSVALLAATGENINVMTLGGLALAVGILVDDATVTIENINFQLEQKKEIEAAIMDGARQIVIPATVSLLCICIVFVPMFALGGVSGYLFRPMAKAVVFALIGSYLLSRTLVPTMANYLLAGQAHDPNAPAKNLFGRFLHGFEQRFEQARRAYAGALASAMRLRWRFVLIFLGFNLASLALFPTLGQNFFPSIQSVELKLHVRGPTGMRIEETARLVKKVEAMIAETAGPGAVAAMVDNIGLPVTGASLAYSNSGTIGASDADILVTLQEGRQDKAEQLVEILREKLPERFPATTFAFLPADIVTQILNFGLPAPIDVQVVGPDAEGNRLHAAKLLRRIAQVTGIADARIQQPADQPTLTVDVDRLQASRLGVAEKNVATSLQVTLAGSIQTNPVFWLNPKNGVSYPVVVQTPEYWMNSLNDLARVPASQGDRDLLLGGIAQIGRGSANAVVSHYSVQPVLDIFATNHGRDLGGVARDVQRVIDDLDRDKPRGTRVTLRGQSQTMNSAYGQLYLGLALAVALIYLLIVVNFQSWTDPFVIITALPAALAGVVWMLFVSHTTLSVPALTGAIMCLGVATANSILVVSFARAQLAEGEDAFTAALNAGIGRFRPVLMTALAMIIGMAPTALSAEQNAPLGRAVIGGLILATLATLIFVPVVFSLAHSRQRNAVGSPAAERTP
jgi:multidrug efflux pump subunit AcrB